MKNETDSDPSAAAKKVPAKKAAGEKAATKKVVVKKAADKEVIRKRPATSGKSASEKALARPEAPKKQVSSDQLPRKSLEAAMRIARALREVHAGGPVAWPELAKAAGLGPAQGNKYYLWAAQAFGLIDREDDQRFTLSETGRKALAPTRAGEDREALVKAVVTPVTLSRFFTDYNGSPFPSDEHLGNILEVRYQVPRDRLEEAGALLKENGIFAGILQKQGDGGYLVSIDQNGTPVHKHSAAAETRGGAPGALDEEGSALPSGDYSKMCFVVTPIGEEDSAERKHANMVLKSVIEPVTTELGFVAVRADSIDRAGIITKQIFEHLARARLCIADLSFNNPNAFYELGIRHTCKLPTVQIIRKGDRIPFDVSQGRTIKIDMTDVYTVIDSIESAKRELRQHLKHILSGDYKGDDNPVNVYLPTLSIGLPK